MPHVSYVAIDDTVRWSICVSVGCASILLELLMLLLLFIMCVCFVMVDVLGRWLSDGGPELPNFR